MSGHNEEQQDWQEAAKRARNAVYVKPGSITVTGKTAKPKRWRKWVVGIVIALLSLYVIAVEAGGAYKNSRWDECSELGTSDMDAYIECIDEIPFIFTGFADLA